MGRLFWPTTRITKFHDYSDSIFRIEKRVKAVKNQFRLKKIEAEQLDLRCRKAYTLLKRGDLLTKRQAVTDNGKVYHPISITTKDDPKGLPPNKRDLEKFEQILNGTRFLANVELQEEEIISFYFIKIIALFEFYLDDVILTAKRFSFFKNQQELAFLKKADLEDQIQRLGTMGIHVPKIKTRLTKAVEFIARRNCILHNNGIVNYYYMNRVKQSKLKNNTKIKIDYSYVIDCSRFFLIFLRSIDDQFCKKVFKVPFSQIHISDTKIYEKLKNDQKVMNRIFRKRTSRSEGKYSDIIKSADFDW